MKRFKINLSTLICTFLLLILVQQCAYAMLRVKYEDTISGDTIKVNSYNNNYSVRFYGIDCEDLLPGERANKQAEHKDISLNQVYANGRWAKYLLQNKIGEDEYLYIKIKCFDNNGNMVAIPYKKNLFLFNTNLSKYMQKNAACSTYL